MSVYTAVKLSGTLVKANVWACAALTENTALISNIKKPTAARNAYELALRELLNFSSFAAEKLIENMFSNTLKPSQLDESFSYIMVNKVVGICKFDVN
ncbi:MAG: hypothetical protein ABJP96_13445 [Erythrobacter sp.]